MRALLRPEEMRKIDERTMEAQSLSSFELMKRVAKTMAEAILPRLRDSSKILVLCGPGNNGGDAYCLAQLLMKAQHRVWILALRDASSEDAKKASRLRRFKEWERDDFSSFDLIIDGVFGSNGKAKLDKDIVDVFKKIRKTKALKISLDVPSGTDADTGQSHPHAFYADLTLCVAYPKWGFIYEALAERLGEVLYVGGKFEKPRTARAYVLEDQDFSLPEEKRTKYKSGHCIVIAGSAQTPGAAFLCAEAAHRTGVGYVSLFLARRSSIKISLNQSSFLYRIGWTWKDLQKADSIVVGPGGAPKNLRALEKIPSPQIWDADALRHVRASSRYPLRILTPHRGEAARLLNLKAAWIQEHPLEGIDLLVNKTQSHAYLKGAPGILRFVEDQTYYVNLSINPAMARAGSGDVLSGIMGGISAQMSDFKKAMIFSLVFQASISKLLWKKRGSIASDQLNLFSEAFKRLQAAS